MKTLLLLLVSSALALAQLTVGPSTITLYEGQVQGFLATGAPAVNWTLNPLVGLVSSQGIYTAPASITALQTITITATSTTDSTMVGTAAITLQPRPPSSISGNGTYTVTAGATGDATRLACTVRQAPNNAGVVQIAITCTGLSSAVYLYSAPTGGPVQIWSLINGNNQITMSVFPYPVGHDLWTITANDTTINGSF